MVGLGEGSDYATTALGAVTLSRTAGQWVWLDATAAAQAWVANPAASYRLVLPEQFYCVLGDYPAPSAWRLR